jgi:hypothetical protein
MKLSEVQLKSVSWTADNIFANITDISNTYNIVLLQFSDHDSSTEVGAEE